MALIAVTDDGALQDVERGEQRGGAVALVVEGHGARLAALHRQARLGPVERLNLGFLVDREDHRMGRWFIPLLERQTVHKAASGSCYCVILPEQFQTGKPGSK